MNPEERVERVFDACRVERIAKGPNRVHMREKGPMIDSVDAVDPGTNAQMA